MPKVTLSSGLKLHHQQAGEGPDLVMIHGLTGNLAVWHLQIVPLLWGEFRITTFDLRGHGYSSMPPSGYSADTMAGDLRELLDALEIERPFIVGHSFGADIALYFALNHPERVEAIVALEPALPAMVYMRAGGEWEGWSYWADVLERCGHPVPADKRSDVDYLLRQSLQVPKKWGPLNGLPRNPKPFLRLMDETTFAADSQIVGSLTLDRIANIATPVVLIYGERSAFLATHDRLYAELPSVRSVLLPRTEWGHFGPLEQPELVAQHILGSLERASS
ncbi:MAG TPA: alpha/beta hydrolase [Solirubrobacteraceae bacterium]|nr:alpha/beta hydrolase [Solirubrobacteraceae bacterium]